VVSLYLHRGKIPLFLESGINVAPCILHCTASLLFHQSIKLFSTSGVFYVAGEVVYLGLRDFIVYNGSIPTDKKYCMIELWFL
jgi:hypothetical protein